MKHLTSAIDHSKKTYVDILSNIKYTSSGYFVFHIFYIHTHTHTHTHTYICIYVYIKREYEDP